MIVPCHDTTTIIKFVCDMTMVGLITKVCLQRQGMEADRWGQKE